MATIQPKRMPCNGCRERKRKCSYEQPCTRCTKAGKECTYTVMPSPNDIEYMQELEYIKQIDALQNQILSMENEIGILKLAKENKSKQGNEQPTSPSSTVANLQDYPSPESVGKSVSVLSDDHPHHHQSAKHKLALFHDSFNDYEGVPPPPPSSLEATLTQPQYPPSPSRAFDALEFMYMNKYNTYKEGHKNGQKKSRYHHSIKSNNIQVELKSQQNNESKPWTLAVKNGNMTIETYISSHSQLMSCLGGMVSTAIYQEKTAQLPFPFSMVPVAHSSASNKVLNILVWKKYGKSRFKSLTKYSPVLMQYPALQQITRVIPVEGLTTITMRLVMSYFNCRHVQHFALYIPEFAKSFMNGDLLKSPAVMAMCSTICHQTCRHSAGILPVEAIRDYALYYFEQARELIEDKFDEISMESLITFTFMAMYKLKTKENDQADKYLTMAERVYDMLLPLHEYKGSSSQEPMGESMLFSRIFRCVYHCRSLLELYDAMKRMFKVRGMGPKKLFELLDSQDNISIHIFPGDSPREVRYIKMLRYLSLLRQTIHECTPFAEAPDFPSYIGLFGHHIEMAMRNWYRNILPDDYQLSLPLFDDHVSDLTFFTTLEVECMESPIPLLTTVTLYNEYLIMAKSYLPKNPAEAQLDTEELIKKFKKMQYTAGHTPQQRRGSSKDDSKKKDGHTFFWLKMLENLKYFRENHKNQFSDYELNLSDEEYFIEFIKTLNPSKINLDMPLIHTSIKSALNTVRIVQFMVSHDCACFLDLRWIMNAWEVLLRAARCNYQQPNDDTITLDRIRANLLLCMSIVEAELKFNNRDPEGEIIEEMNHQFEELFAI